jgi:CRISPR-associated protein Cas1
VLRATVARSLVGSGLLPTLGIHHRNKYNAFCLADDIMEPYRPFVDKLVDILKDFDDVSELTTELKARLLVIPALDVVIEGKNSPLMIATQRTTSSLNECFEGISRKILYPSL